MTLWTLSSDIHSAVQNSRGRESEIGSVHGIPDFRGDVAHEFRSELRQFACE